MNATYNPKYRYAISAIASRESLYTLQKTLACCIDAAQMQHAPVVINILVNGNPALYDQLVDASKEIQFDASKPVDVNLFHYETGDKSNTVNEYIYSFRNKALIHVLIDGYVWVHADTLLKIDRELHRKPFLAATGIPSMGRGARVLREQMLKEGGMHGNMCILSDACLSKIVEHDFRIPVFLYRSDGLLGAIINFNFEPASNAWDSRRVKVISDLTWTIPQGQLLHPRLIVVYFKRRLRQLQGNIENRAIKRLLSDEKREIGELPDNVYQLCAEQLALERFSFFDYLISPLRAYVRNRLLSMQAQMGDRLSQRNRCRLYRVYGGASAKQYN